MNALNLLSSRVIGQPSAVTRARSKSQGEALTAKQSQELLRGRSHSDDNLVKSEKDVALVKSEPVEPETDVGEDPETPQDGADEETYLLEENTNTKTSTSTSQSRLRRLVKRLAEALTAIFATIGAPVVYFVRCFRDEDGRYSAIVPLKRIHRALRRGNPSQSTSSALGLKHAPEKDSWDSEKPGKPPSHVEQLKRSYSSDSLASATSESEPDAASIRHSTLKRDPRQVTEEPRRQSIRIKLNNEEALKKRRSKRSGRADSSTAPLTVDTIKSPTSSSLKATKYPHAPKPPRPLVPRRQPSYSNFLSKTRSLNPSPSQPQQKTLVLDLDETLIHSLAKGGRMSSGYMVEVKLNQPVALAPAQTGRSPPILGPQHPILYYVHKRPHCHEFLRKVSKWYKLVIFTASVQEYADPVIDLLETEKKYFSARYYRQHCTFRNGAYIKDLSSVEPDLSKVMILDNSPVSYIFHEDNAIPIEGWINDPTDNDLLHLVPLLEALQYVPDVRALLALRRGEAETS